MNIKLSEVVSMATPNKEGQSIFSQLQEVNFPIKVSYRLKKLVNKLQPDLTIYDEKRNSLIKEYGDEPDEKGTIRVTDPEKLKAFSEKATELLNVEVDVEWEPLKLEDLGDINIPTKLLNNSLFE